MSTDPVKLLALRVIADVSRDRLRQVNIVADQLRIRLADKTDPVDRADARAALCSIQENAEGALDNLGSIVETLTELLDQRRSEERREETCP